MPKEEGQDLQGGLQSLSCGLRGPPGEEKLSNITSQVRSGSAEQKHLDQGSAQSREKIGQVQEVDLHGHPSPPLSQREGIREVWGSQAQAWGLRRQRSQGTSTMAWALLLLSLLSQGTGEASGEGTRGLLG